MSANAPRLQAGPPWIGPVVSRTDYERQFLWVHGAMLLSGIVFFGWRALTMVALMSLTTLGAYTLVSLGLRVRGRRPVASPLYAMNMAMLLPLTLPVSRGLSAGVGAACVMGLLVHVVGPAHRVRVHPVALAHLLLLLGLPFPPGPPVHAVLAPQRVVIGEVLNISQRVGGPTWMRMSVTAPGDAIQRDAPGRVMLLEQRDVLMHAPRLAALLRQNPPDAPTPDSHQLPRLIDVLIGAVPGPVGATSAFVLIFGGIYLMQRRVSRWPMVVAALGAATVTWLLVPAGGEETGAPSILRLIDLGPRVALSYLAYQIIATPLPLILLVMAPLTMPRATRGRVFYACIVGVGFVLSRWYSTYEEAGYLPLVAAGMVSPLLDRMRESPFVRST